MLLTTTGEIGQVVKFLLHMLYYVFLLLISYCPRGSHTNHHNEAWSVILSRNLSPQVSGMTARQYDVSKLFSHPLSSPRVSIVISNTGACSATLAVVHWGSAMYSAHTNNADVSLVLYSEDSSSWYILIWTIEMKVLELSVRFRGNCY